MRTVIISGYFNPLHGGHLDLIEGAATLGDRLIVIVNSDEQQMLKKGKIILDEGNRVRLMRALRDVDEVVLSIDGSDMGQRKTIEMIAKKYPNDELIFANGGARDSDKTIPEAEVCKQYSIRLEFGVGGTDNTDSSTRINQALGHQE